VDKGFLESCLAEGLSLEAIGKRAGKHPSTVSYWLDKHGLSAVGAERYRNRGAVCRSRLVRLVEAGATLAEIADQLERSVSTVRYWLERHEIERPNRRRSCRGRRDGAKFATFECRRHGLTEFVLEGRGYYRCKACRSEAVARRRRAVKQRLVAEAGGSCQLCGYSRCLGALQFHHVEPHGKEFHLAHRGHSRSIARSRAEMRKCVLLCANCHAEVEGGFANLPVESRGSSDDEAVITTEDALIDRG
jgi:hypothetical protein